MPGWLGDRLHRCYLWVTAESGAMQKQGWLTLVSPDTLPRVGENVQLDKVGIWLPRPLAHQLASASFSDSK